MSGGRGHYNPRLNMASFTVIFRGWVYTSAVDDMESECGLDR